MIVTIIEQLFNAGIPRGHYVLRPEFGGEVS